MGLLTVAIFQIPLKYGLVAGIWVIPCLSSDFCHALAKTLYEILLTKVSEKQSEKIQDFVQKSLKQIDFVKNVIAPDNLSTKITKLIK